MNRLPCVYNTTLYPDGYTSIGGHVLHHSNPKRGGGRGGHVLHHSNPKEGGGGGKGHRHCPGGLGLGIRRTPGPRMFGQFFEGRIFTSLTTLSCKRMRVQCIQTLFRNISNISCVLDTRPFPAACKCSFA